MARLKITLVRSYIGRPEEQRKIGYSLGLRKLHSTVYHDDTPAIRGMVRKIAHLVKVEKGGD